MDVLGSIVYSLLIIIFIVLIFVVGYLYYDYKNHKDSLREELDNTTRLNNEKDAFLNKGIIDNSSYISNTSNILHNYSSNLNFDTSNILHNYTTKLNTENLEIYNKSNENINNNLNDYFIFGLNTDKNKITNEWEKSLTESENDKYDKLELIRATSIISGLTIKSESDKKSLDICNTEGGTNCYSLNYDDNILKIKNKSNLPNSSVEIGSLKVHEDISGVYIDNISSISSDKSINIGKLKITNVGITWDGKKLCDPTTDICSVTTPATTPATTPVTTPTNE
jgi:hypothetical protein